MYRMCVHRVHSTGGFVMNGFYLVVDLALCAPKKVPALWRDRSLREESCQKVYLVLIYSWFVLS